MKSWLAYYDDALAVDEPAAVAEAQIEQKDAGESFGEEAYELWEEVESNVTDRPRNIEAAHHPDLGKNALCIGQQPLQLLLPLLLLCCCLRVMATQGYLSRC